MKRTPTVTWMRLTLVAIAMLFIGLIGRELWSITHPIRSNLTPLGIDALYCGTPMFVGSNAPTEIFQILLVCAYLLPLAFGPWLLARLMSLLPFPTKHELSEMWWRLRGRNG